MSCGQCGGVFGKKKGKKREHVTVSHDAVSSAVQFTALVVEYGVFHYTSIVSYTSIVYYTSTVYHTDIVSYSSIVVYFPTLIYSFLH